MILEEFHSKSWTGRLIPRAVVANNNSALTAAFRNLVEDGVLVIVFGMDVSSAVTGETFNAVLPAWRDNVLDIQLLS